MESSFGLKKSENFNFGQSSIGNNWAKDHYTDLVFSTNRNFFILLRKGLEKRIQLLMFKEKNIFFILFY